jgi:3-oxoacyl-[acyl-carrier protein] reductase
MKVFITGAASGIGRATAQRFYDDGSEIVLIDMPSLEKTQLTEQFPSRMTYLQADVTRTEGINAISENLKAGVDVFINNAGITRDSTIFKMTEEQWDQVLAVNLTAVFKLSQTAAKIMKKQGHGVILNAASVVAHHGNFGQANYVASKAGVIGMTKTLAKELGKYNVRVNAVAPGFIGTQMVLQIPEKVINMMEEKTPLKRVGRPEEIAAAYAFLASSDASFITGTCLNVDGGLII